MTFLFTYLILDILIRDLVGWVLWEEESADHASQLIRWAVTTQNSRHSKEPLILNSDNGYPMKGATMLVVLNEYAFIMNYIREAKEVILPFEYTI